jgi:hypothetical protein
VHLRLEHAAPSVYAVPARSGTLDRDCNPVDYQEIWEYLGQDEDGVFKIHIEFDEAHIARIVAKDTKKGPIVVLAAASKAKGQHQH